MTQGALDEITYPTSDGERMAENTLQYEWIVLLRENIHRLVPDFVAADLLWYPVKGDPKTRVAPDVFVAFGRPKGYRGSYKQWEEGGTAPQVVFEVLSPGNTVKEMQRKLAFYQRFGVEEYYLVDPEEPGVQGFIRTQSRLAVVPDMEGFTSPRLGIRFHFEGDRLVVLAPDGSRFESFDEVRDRLEAQEARTARERSRADEEKARADEEKARADALEAELAALRTQLTSED